MGMTKNYLTKKGEVIKEKRKKHKKKQLWFCLLDWMAIMAVYVLVVFGTVTSWGRNDFYLTHHMEYLIKYGVVHNNFSKDNVKLANVYNRETLIDYLKDSLSYMFGTLVWYNGQPLTFEGDKFKETGWVIDFTNRMIGVVRLRLKRTKIENCVPTLLRKLMPSVKCVKPLTNANEDKNNYSTAWLPKSKSYTDSAMVPWSYKSSSHVQALIKYGKTGRYYTSGGYFLNLARTSDGTNRIIERMEESNWFSKAVEVMFIDISMYSPNYNMIKVISVCLEKRAGYGINLKFQMINLPAYTKFPAKDIIISLFLGIVLLFLIADLFISILVMRTAFFHSFWNILDVLIVPLFALNLIYSLKYKIALKFSIEHDLRSGKDKFFYFGWIDYYSYAYYSLYTLLFVFCSIKPLKYCVDTLQVLPIVMAIRSAWHLIFYISLFVLPFLYIEFSVIDSLLSNSQIISNRFPLVNKVGLKNYAEMYTFPENRLVPYLYCQLCSVVIGLLSVFIIHHYIITKNSLLLTSNTTDLLFELKKWMQSGKRKDQLMTLKNKFKPIIGQRLRSGADCFEKLQTTSQPIEKPQSFPMKHTTFKQLEDDKREYKWSHDKVYTKKQVGKGNERNINTILKNIDMKLDKIVKNLQSINEES